MDRQVDRLIERQIDGLKGKQMDRKVDRLIER